MGCSVSGDTPQCRLEESISHRRTRQVTQLFTYLLTDAQDCSKRTSLVSYGKRHFRPHRMHCLDVGCCQRWSVCKCRLTAVEHTGLCWSHMSPAKTAEPIEMPLGSLYKSWLLTICTYTGV